MSGGYMGRIGFVDLSTGEVRTEKLDEALARQFIGGYGLGVRVVFERQPAGVQIARNDITWNCLVTRWMLPSTKRIRIHSRCWYEGRGLDR